MVVATLDNTKTVTRRIVKGMALDWLNEGFTPDFIADPGNSALCPYGKVGDVLWVREKHLVNPNDKVEFVYPDYMPDGLAMRWKPSIHMKKDYARLWLEITSIKIEKLNDITDEDAVKEGVLLGEAADGEKLYKDYNYNFFVFDSPWVSFKTLWESINGEDSWDLNPWVWRVEFKVLSKTGKP